MEYSEIRRSLKTHLHQDYDLESGSIAECIFNTVKESDLDALRAELDDLRMRPNSTIEEVLNDHAVGLWDSVSSHELLCTLITLAELFRPSPYDESGLRIRNARIE